MDSISDYFEGDEVKDVERDLSMSGGVFNGELELLYDEYTSDFDTLTFDNFDWFKLTEEFVEGYLDAEKDFDGIEHGDFETCIATIHLTDGSPSSYHVQLVYENGRFVEDIEWITE